MTAYRTIGCPGHSVRCTDGGVMKALRVFPRGLHSPPLPLLIPGLLQPCFRIGAVVASTSSFDFQQVGRSFVAPF